MSVRALAGLDETEVLRLGASVEAGSEHPLAAAVIEAATARGALRGAMDSFVSHPGRGVTGRVDRQSVALGNLALMIERGDIVLPRAELWPEGIDELEAFEYSVTEAGNVRTSAPYGTHDDCVIGLALAAWSIRAGKPTPRIDWI